MLLTLYNNHSLTFFVFQINSPNGAVNQLVNNFMNQLLQDTNPHLQQTTSTASSASSQPQSTTTSTPSSTAGSTGTPPTAGRTDTGSTDPFVQVILIS